MKKSVQYRRQFPVNHYDLTWRHPEVKPTEDDSYLGLFGAIDRATGEWYYQYADAMFFSGDWHHDDALFDDEPNLEYGIIAWMPYPDIPKEAAR